MYIYIYTPVIIIYIVHIILCITYIAHYALNFKCDILHKLMLHISFCTILVDHITIYQIILHYNT